MLGTCSEESARAFASWVLCRFEPRAGAWAGVEAEAKEAGARAGARLATGRGRALAARQPWEIQGGSGNHIVSTSLDNINLTDSKDYSRNSSRDS